MFFKHFASKNQLPVFFVSGTLVEHGLINSLNFLNIRSKICERSLTQVYFYNAIGQKTKVLCLNLKCICNNKYYSDSGEGGYKIPKLLFSEGLEWRWGGGVGG